jgi:hypothetical protein
MWLIFDFFPAEFDGYPVFVIMQPSHVAIILLLLIEEFFASAMVQKFCGSTSV